MISRVDVKIGTRLLSEFAIVEIIKINSEVEVRCINILKKCYWTIGQTGYISLMDWRILKGQNKICIY